MLNKKNVPLFLRLSSAAIKILFLMYLASLGDATNLGNYALFVVVVGLATQLLGVEINAELARRIHQRLASQRIELISAQFLFHLATYVVVLPALIVLFEFLFHLGVGISLILSLLIVFEHAAVEIYRLLVTLGRHEVASLFQFFRTMPYIVALISLNLFHHIELSLQLVAYFWIVNTAIAVTIFILNYRIQISTLRIRPWKFLKIAKLMVVRARSYYVITCLGAAIAYLDKFILSFTIGKEAMGVYFYISSFAVIINLWLASTLGVVEGPKLIRKYYQCNGGVNILDNRSLLEKYIWNGIIMAIVAMSTFWMLSLFGLNQYISEFDVLVVLIVSTLLSSLADPVKLRLYLERQDAALLKIYVCSLGILVVGVLVLSNVLGSLGAGIAHLLSSAVFLYGLFIYKSNKFLPTKIN